MELNCWKLHQQPKNCRQWFQSAYHHDLWGVQQFNAMIQPNTVNIAHLFACGTSRSGGLARSRDVLSYLLENGGDLNAVDVNGWLPINYAVWFGHAGTTDVLLELGSPVQNHYAPQPLDTAFSALTQHQNSGAETCAKLLLLSGADPNKGLSADMQFGGISWLTWALEQERFEWAELLWKKGARITKDKEIHLLLLRASSKSLAWAQYQGMDILGKIDPSHDAYNNVYQAQSLRVKEQLLQNLAPLLTKNETETDEKSGKGRRKL